jgi:hypothetical protein
MATAAVVGMTQGKRALTRDAATGRWMAEGPDRSGALLMRPPGATSAGSAAIDSALRRRPLDELHEDVRGILKAAR